MGNLCAHSFGHALGLVGLVIVLPGGVAVAARRPHCRPVPAQNDCARHPALSAICSLALAFVSWQHRPFRTGRFSHAGIVFFTRSLRSSSATPISFRRSFHSTNLYLILLISAIGRTFGWRHAALIFRSSSRAMLLERCHLEQQRLSDRIGGLDRRSADCSSCAQDFIFYVLDAACALAFFFLVLQFGAATAAAAASAMPGAA